MPACGCSAAPKLQSSHSGARVSLPKSKAEEEHVDNELRQHKLVPHETVAISGDNVHCFFFSFLDGRKHSGNPPKHSDHFQPRKQAKACMHAIYKPLLDQGIIDQWHQEQPDLAGKFHVAGLKQEWMNYCKGYTLFGHVPKGTRLRMGDKNTCWAVANIYKYKLQVHTKAGIKFF